MTKQELYEFLEEKHERYNRPEFIENDPISIPHLFNKKEDIEIAGFLTAVIAWGQRTTIINNAKKLMKWMDYNPFDFGIWDKIRMSRLYCPLDVHSGRVARKLGLLKRRQSDWKAVTELTGKLSEFDPADPVKYDFALFGLGVTERF